MKKLLFRKSIFELLLNLTQSIIFTVFVIVNSMYYFCFLILSSLLPLFLIALLFILWLIFDFFYHFLLICYHYYYFSIFYHWNHHHYFYILWMMISIFLDHFEVHYLFTIFSLYVLNTMFYAFFSPSETPFLSFHENRAITVSLVLFQQYLYFHIRIQIIYWCWYYYFIACKC